MVDELLKSVMYSYPFYLF